MIVSLYVLFEILSIVLCLHYLYGEKFRLDKVTIVFLIVEMSWMHILYFGKMEYNLSVLIYPIIFIYSGLRFGFKLKSMIINNMLYIIMLSIIQATIILVMNFGLKIRSIGIVESLIINFIVFLIVILVLNRLRLHKLSVILQDNDKIIIMSLVVIISGIIIFFINFRYGRGLNVSYYIILVVSFVLMSVAAVDIGKHKLKAKEIATELRLHKLYEQSFRNLIEDICAKQHEFDNHINTIYSQHFVCNSYEELVGIQKKYCNDIVKANRHNKLLSKGNPLIIGFLYGKFLEIEREGICLIYKINIGDMNCEIPVYKLVTLLGNLIDNAVEEIKRCEYLNEIDVLLRENSENILIEVCNDCENIDYSIVHDFFIKGYSNKGENRGYGLYNVRKICQEYGIVMQTTIEEKVNPRKIRFSLEISKSL